MKKIFKIFLLTGITVGLFNIAEAQRDRGGNNSSDRGSRGGGGSYRQHEDRGGRGNVAQVRTFPGNPGTNRNNNFYRGNNNVRTVPRSNETNRISPQRDYNNRTSSQRNIVSSRAYNNRQYQVPRNNYRYSNYRNSYNYYSNNYYRDGRGYRTNFMFGPRYTYIPRNSISIYFGGSPYYYNQGYFYGYFGGYYQPLFPPFGLRIGILPFGYTRFYIGVDPFYYYNGIYYRQYDDNNYEVVDAPMGATVSSLPKGAKSVVVNGEKLYELNGTYYKADRDSKGNEVYTVVGKNGEINNTDENNNVTAPPSPSLQIGSVVSQLPEGSKIVTINGEKVYVTPDGSYLKEENVDGEVQYRVVGN